jgi:hypothetical protein
LIPPAVLLVRGDAGGIVDQWHAAASALRSYVEARGEWSLDLENLSTLAAMYVAARQVA